MSIHPSSNYAPVKLEAKSLPEVYSRVIGYIAGHKGKSISPLCLTISNAGFEEMVGKDEKLRDALDKLLKARGDLEIETVAFTIFPQEYYLLSNDRADFFAEYRAVFPRLQALDSRNKNGLYFERLTMWPEGPCEGNQLEWIIDQYCSRKGVRTSMFQASIFNPAIDHTASAQLGFPCLQHVSFVPKDGELVMNAFYATQQLLRKAYGNYLGLLRLGGFMAKEMKLNFTRLNVFVGVAKLDEIGKTTAEFEPILSTATEIVESI